MSLSNVLLIPTAQPNVNITWLDLQATFVNLTWQLLDGSVTVLQLRHANFTYNPLSVLAASLYSSNIDISTWDVIKDDIGPEETNVVAYSTGVNFDLDLYNLFAIVPFEDTQLHNGGQFTGTVSQLVVEPQPPPIVCKFSQTILLIYEISAHQFHIYICTIAL